MEFNKEKLDRYFLGEHDTEDRIYVEQLFRDKDKEEELKQYLFDQWEVSLYTTELTKVDLNHIKKNLLQKAEKSKKNKEVIFKIWRVYARLAAMLLLPLGIMYMLFLQFNNAELHNEESSISINAPFGSKLHFTLPDGSSGWLNSGSTLIYPAQFKNTRDVSLEGEAWFNVKKDVQRPFNVITSAANISVLGTKFNVNTYQNGKTDVVLESGKVVLTGKKDNMALEMSPQERVIIDTENNIVNRSNVKETDKFSGWKDGKLVFRNDTMEEVAKRLGRWYNVSVEIKNNYKNDLRLRAVFEDEDIEEFLRLLKMSFPIEYEIGKREKDANQEFIKRKIKITIQQ